jgi:hypothetical protein
MATLVLLAAVVAASVWLIGRAARELGDPALRKLIYVFLGKLAILLLVLVPLWQRHLGAGPDALQGDQERYYFQAESFARDGFDIARIPSVNYPGVLFIYGGIFRLFGHNAYAAAIVNSFASLLAALLLVRVAYKIDPAPGKWKWLMALWIVVPEVVLHDAMTSRDALAMSLLAIFVSSVADYMLDERGSVVRMARWAMPSVVLLALVRATAVAPAVVASLLLLPLVVRKWTRPRTLAFAAAAVMAVLFVLAAPRLSRVLGGYDVRFADMLDKTVVAPDSPLLMTYHWSRRSIGRLLVPDNALEAVLLAPVRMIAYVIAPLPTATGVQIGGLGVGQWNAVQSLLVLLSSLLYIVLFPLAVASLIAAIRNNRRALALHLPFWITILAIASGTAVIHERYRLMSVPLFIGCVWLVRRATMRQVRATALGWFSAIAVGATAALLYKRMPCEMPVIAASAPPVTIAPRQRVTLTVRVGGPEVQLQWFQGSSGFMGAPIPGADGTSVTVAPEVTSSFWLYAANECGSAKSETAVVTVEVPR